jgi:23S rRNA pseudouridine1911/1915/1917 synthase
MGHPVPSTWVVVPPASGEEAAGALDRMSRIDRYIAHHLDVPRNQVQRWLRDDRVLKNGKPASGSDSVSVGDEIACDPPVPGDDRVVAESGDLAILFEDSELLVIDKPAGLAVHPGAGRATGTLAHFLLGHDASIAGVGGPGRPGIVHRLDLGTSGALVVAKTPEAYRALSEAFADRSIDKRYLALVHGAPKIAAGTIDAPIGRHPVNRQEMAVVPRGRPARTDYKTLATAGGLALLTFHLHTGRTHQIRVHAKHLGHPLVGDPVYGEARWKTLEKTRQGVVRDFPRPALHAWRIGFAHPKTGAPLSFEAPVPEDLRALWQAATGTPWPNLPS